MGKIDIDYLVEIYNDVIDFDNKEKDLRVYVFKDKKDLVKKYVEMNLIKMKVNEPITGETYEKNFSNYLKEINLLSKTFSDDEIIIIGVFGNDVNLTDLENNDINIYHISELDLLIEDITEFYGNS